MNFGVELGIGVLFYGLCHHKRNLKSRIISKLDKNGDNKITLDEQTRLRKLFGRNLLQNKIYFVFGK